jgi:GTPase SAR1 family protein
VRNFKNPTKREMGNCNAAGGDLAPEERNKLNDLKSNDAALNKQARIKKEQEDHIAKLLLLGTGESGKSTVFRQMIKCFGKGFADDQRVAYRSAIFQNIIDCVLIIIQECMQREEDAKSQAPDSEAAQFALSDKAKAAMKLIVDQKVKRDDKLSVNLAKAIKVLWDDPGFKHTFHKRQSILISESAEYFLDKVEAVAQDSYLPTDDDLLHVRIKTSGLIKEDFQIENLKFRLHDVGGQRNERRKWIHCFEEVTAVIFITAISEYDQVCYEDEETNRMIESLNLFEELANSRWFVNTAMILFLNKQDLFDKKFTEVPLQKCFPDWPGGSKEEAYEFIKEKFTARLSRKRDIFSHVTNATNSDNIMKVFHAVRHIIVKSQLTDGGFL